MTDDDFLIERLSLEIKQVVRATIKEILFDESDNGFLFAVASDVHEAVHDAIVDSKNEPVQPQPSRYYDPSNPLMVDLYEFRDRVAREAEISPTAVLNGLTIKDIVDKMPSNHEDLLLVHGIGEKKALWWGDDIIKAVNANRLALAVMRYRPVNNVPLTGVAVVSVNKLAEAYNAVVALPEGSRDVIKVLLGFGVVGPDGQSLMKRLLLDGVVIPSSDSPSFVFCRAGK